MKKYLCLLITVLTLLAGVNCYAELAFLDESKFHMPQIKRIYGVYFVKGATAAKYLSFPLTIILSGKEVITYKDLSEFPKSDVYAGNGNFYVKYENNHGYMPIWRIK